MQVRIGMLYPCFQGPESDRGKTRQSQSAFGELSLAISGIALAAGTKCG